MKITEPKVISHGQEFPIETQLSFSPETYPSIKFYLVNQSNKSIDAIGKITIQRIDIKEEVGKYQQRIKLKPKERQRIVLRMPQIETTGVYNSIVQYYLDNKPVSKLLKFQWEVKTPLKEVVKKEIPLKKKFVSMMFGILLILIGILIILKMKKTSGSKIIMLLVGLILGLFFVNSHNAYALRSCPEVDLSCVNYHYVTSNCNFSNSSADNYCKNKYGTGWKGCCLNGNAYCYKYKPNGTSCGASNYGPWSNCSGFSDICDETGTQSRTVVYYLCWNGKCKSVSKTETRSCTRDTDGISCGICKHCSNGSCTNDVAGTSCVTQEGEPGKCDGNGNCVIEDSEKPVITEISHSPESPTNSDTVSISTSATDNKGLKYLDIYVGAENVGAFLVKRCDCDSKLTCSCSWSYSNPPIGTYIYYSIATDINYNTAVSAQKTLTVSEISINAPSDLTLSPVPCEKIILEWQDNSENEEGFIIEKGTESGGGAGGSIIIYQEPVYLPDLLKTASVYPENPYQEENNHILNIFPNPAGKYFIIEYDLSDYTEELFITIRDINSKQLKIVKLSNSHTQKVISTANFPNGTYLIQLYHNKYILEATKIIIYK